MSFERLPQEIRDMIIDFLHEDKCSLRACSLVCRSWTAAAQYHILCSYRLTADPKKGGYAVQLRPLLQSRSNPHIRELVLTPGPSRYSPLSELTMDVLLTVLTTFRNLHHLNLSETGFVKASDLRPTARFHLRRLMISWMYFSSPGTSHGFQDVLGLFEDIRELSLGPIHPKHLSGETDFMEPTPSSLTTTRVQNLVLTEVSPHLVATLSGLICADHLKTVKACITAATEVSQLGALLHSVGLELEQFQLAIWAFWLSDIIDWAALNLAACPKLHSVVVLYANSGAFYSWQTVLDILDVVPPTIRDLTIVVRESGCFNTLSWRHMDERLAKFTQLQQLRFRLCRGGDPFRSKEVGADIMLDICSALPALKAKNVLAL